ncbi:MAG: DNA translocase FtsK [Muribaculaceae bacterium]|nr:DNA translocase FtsK [Muribaculaceae bacterium]
MSDYDSYRPEITYSEELPPAALLDEKKDDKGRVTGRKVNNGKKINKKKAKRPLEKNDSIRKEKDTEKIPFIDKIVDALTSTSARLLLGIFLGCFAIYLGVAFFSYFSSCIQDQSAVNTYAVGSAPVISNSAGEGGARLSEFLINETFGLGSFVIVFWLGAMSLKLLTGRPRFKSVNFTIKCIVALITVSLIVGLTTIAMHSSVNWGGYHGRYVNEFIIHFFGGIGATLLCVFMIALFVVICLRDLVGWIIRMKHKRDEKRRIIAEQKAAEEAHREEIRRQQEEERIEDLQAGETVNLGMETIPEAMEDPVSFDQTQPLYSIENDDIYSPSSLEEEKEDTEDIMPLPASENGLMKSYDITGERNEDENNGFSDGNVASESSNADTSGSSEEKESEKEVEGENSENDSDQVDSDLDNVESASEPTDTMRVNVNQIAEATVPHYKVGEGPADNYPYEFPPFEILRPGVDRISVDNEEQLENKEKIRSTLLDFGIPITRIEATVGPTVTLYEIVPDKGVKIAKIRSLVDDIALSLSAKGVRIIAPIPGKGTVGIEVANKDPQVVSMRTIIKSKKFQESKYTLPVAIGSTISNDVYIADLAKMPHLLVAGATGQGKSVGLNAIIASLLYCKRPNELKFVMIDPKQVEFSLYNKIKDHYMAVIPSEVDEEPVITDMQKVEATLNSLCIEMDNRYNLLKNAHTRNIEEYNAKYKAGKLNPAEGHRVLPYIVVVVDEFGDLIMVSGKNVEMPIARLAQKARAVGMHVIIATQRPSTNVITGIIKANFPARMSFKVSSGVDSKTILDTTGAQQLIGRGDMLIFNNSEMVRVQCAFIDTPEVEAICDFVEKQPYAQGTYLLPEPMLGDGDGESGNGGGITGDRDPLFEEAANIVVNSGTASTSYLQRRFSIGYNRAGKIMDQLEAMGIVGASQGGKPRAVLVDQIGLEQILSTI